MRQNDHVQGKKTFGSLVPGILFFVAGLLSLSVFFPIVKAQFESTGQSLEVSPPSQEFADVAPGSTLTVKAKIRNRSKGTLPIAVRIEDFIASGNEGQVALTDKGPWAVSTWASVTPKKFDLPAGETQEVEASIQIPSTGAAGGRYGSFVFAVEGKGGTPGVAAVSQEVASLFLINIAGPVEQKLSVTSFTAPQFSEFGPIPFSVDYKNDGNVHMKPAGVISVTDVLGRKIADVPVTATNVFPQASRIVKVNWNEGLLVGPFVATAILYTNGKGNETVSMTTSFFVFPVRIAVILCIVIFLILRFRKRITKAVQALAGK